MANRLALVDSCNCFVCLIDLEDESQSNRYLIQPSADGRDSRLMVADTNADAVTVLQVANRLALVDSCNCFVCLIDPEDEAPKGLSDKLLATLGSEVPESREFGTHKTVKARSRP